MFPVRLEFPFSRRRSTSLDVFDGFSHGASSMEPPSLPVLRDPQLGHRIGSVSHRGAFPVVLRSRGAGVLHGSARGGAAWRWSASGHKIFPQDKAAR